jgi:hypothetical protein
VGAHEDHFGHGGPELRPDYGQGSRCDWRDVDERWWRGKLCLCDLNVGHTLTLFSTLQTWTVTDIDVPAFTFGQFQRAIDKHRKISSSR